MKKVYIFGKDSCDVCKETYKKIKYFKKKENFSADVRYFDMDTVDGLAEGSFYEVSDIPTVIVLDDAHELMRWVKQPPISKEFLPFVA